MRLPISASSLLVSRYDVELSLQLVRPALRVLVVHDRHLLVVVLLLPDSVEVCSELRLVFAEQCQCGLILLEFLLDRGQNAPACVENIEFVSLPTRLVAVVLRIEHVAVIVFEWVIRLFRLLADSQTSLPLLLLRCLSSIAIAPVQIVQRFGLQTGISMSHVRFRVPACMVVIVVVVTLVMRVLVERLNPLDGTRVLLVLFVVFREVLLH